jgi:tRNA modification GTPase
MHISEHEVEAQREAAIVTPVPGTTRDILELSLDIDGLPVIVADTAGLRNTDDVVENIGVKRAKNAYVASLHLSTTPKCLYEVVYKKPTFLSAFFHCQKYSPKLNLVF